MNLDTVVNDLNLPLNLTGLANNDVTSALNDVADGLGAQVCRSAVSKGINALVAASANDGACFCAASLLSIWLQGDIRSS